jgi:hypothetical protein
MSVHRTVEAYKKWKDIATREWHRANKAEAKVRKMRGIAQAKLDCTSDHPASQLGFDATLKAILDS